MAEAKEVYYVYQCFVDGVLRYIGMGKKERYKHCTSGKSSCIELNKDLFGGKEMVVSFVEKGLTEDAACELEEKLISENRDTLYNKVVKAIKPKTPGIARMKNSRVVASNWSYEDSKVSIYQDKARSIFPDIETERQVLEVLVQSGLALHVVELESGAKMLVLDKANEYEIDANYKVMFSHLAHPEGFWSAIEGLETEKARF